MNVAFFDGREELYHHTKFGEDRTMRASCRCDNLVFVFFTARLSWQPTGIRFTECVGGQKSAFSLLREKLCV